MEKNSQKIADLAGMFEDVDIEVITSVLEMCEGKVNKSAEILLKMKEDNQAHKKSESEEQKEPIFNNRFLEIDEENADVKHLSNPVLQDQESEEEYLAQIQKAIQLSLDESKKNQKNQKNDPKQNKKNPETSKKNPKNDPIQDKKTVNQKEIVSKKIEKSKSKSEKVEGDLDEEIITFIFTKTVMIRGETLS